ncbi:hypothetical protein [Treponema sp. UBA7570]|uniref:hypothetical protein n=1 Tax=Treponema sp. UBA7570 TaxID=1947749 RepID=UPI0025FB6117|nr:hypothetical protein [Treponema sp. UBA7570]
MKKNKVVFYLVFGALLFCCLVFAGCNIDDDGSNSDSGGSGIPSGSGGSSSGSVETATTVTSEITSFNSSDKIDISF